MIHNKSLPKQNQLIGHSSWGWLEMESISIILIFFMPDQILLHSVKASDCKLWKEMKKRIIKTTIVNGLPFLQWQTAINCLICNWWFLWQKYAKFACETCFHQATIKHFFAAPLDGMDLDNLILMKRGHLSKIDNEQWIKKI